MSRLGSTLLTDVRIQLRNGFYHASGFVMLFFVLALLQIPDHYVKSLAAACVFGNLMVNTFYFKAALILLEKAEGNLEAISVTPLRGRE